MVVFIVLFAISVMQVASCGMRVRQMVRTAYQRGFLACIVSPIIVKKGAMSHLTCINTKQRDCQFLLLVFQMSLTCSHRLLFANMDVRECMFNMLPLSTILAFAATCRNHHEAVVIFLHHQIFRLVAHFIDQPSAFFDLLHCTQAVISGSAILQTLFAFENTYLHADDLDVYVEYGDVALFTEFLQMLGFHLAASATSQPYAHGSIRSIITFHHKHSKVDIIESCTPSSVSLIFKFHSTAVMNYISADAIFSAYPYLTAHK